MYHQFKELADVDITKEPMEVGPTCHYMMGGVRVDADTTATTRARACSRPARWRAGMHGANRLGGNSLSDLLVFGRRAGLHAAEYAQDAPAAARRSTPGQVEAAVRDDAGAVRAAAGGENPYAIQADLQEMHAEPGRHHPRPRRS